MNPTNKGDSRERPAILNNLKIKTMPLDTKQTMPYYDTADNGALPQQQVWTQSSLINSNNSGTNPQTISQLVIPANTIRNTGDWIEWDQYFEFLTGSGTKTIAGRIDGADLLILNSTAAFAAIWVKYKAIYLGTSFVLLAGQARSSNTNLAALAWGQIPFNPTAATYLSLVVTAGIANDIKVQYQTVTINKV